MGFDGVSMERRRLTKFHRILFVIRAYRMALNTLNAPFKHPEKGGGAQKKQKNMRVDYC